MQLTEERWGHILDGHPELADHGTDVVDTIQVPTRQMAGRQPGEEWFYRADVGPSRWLKVVVRYDREGRGHVVTAFARRSMP